MKSKKTFVAILMAAALLVPSIVSAAPSAVKVTVDGKSVVFPDAKPYVESSRVLIPVRFVSESLGGKVDYKNRTVTVKQDNKLISLKVDTKNVSVGGDTVVLDVPARIKQSRTYVPLRFVSEALGATVHYQDRTVTITTGKGSVTVPEEDFTPDPKYNQLAPLLFKDNMRIEGNELVFTMPDLKGRTKGSYSEFGQDDVDLKPGQQYRFKLGSNSNLSLSFAHHDENIEGYMIYLDPQDSDLKGKYDSISGDVVVVSMNITTAKSSGTLADVLKRFE